MRHLRPLAALLLAGLAFLPATAGAAKRPNVCKAVPKSQVAAALQLQITDAGRASAGTQSICDYGPADPDLPNVLIGTRPGTRSDFRKVKHASASAVQQASGQPGLTIEMHRVAGAGGPAFSYTETYPFGDGTGHAYRVVLVFRHKRITGFSIDVLGGDLSAVPSIDGFARLARRTRAEI